MSSLVRNPVPAQGDYRSIVNRVEDAVDVDVDGVAIRNSAGNQYDPPVTRAMLIVARSDPRRTSRS